MIRRVDMADDTDTTRPGEAEAVDVICEDPAFTALSTPQIQRAVAAVYPVIAAAVREKTAQDIEAEVARYLGSLKGCALLDAARVARGGR